MAMFNDPIEEKDASLDNTGGGKDPKPSTANPYEDTEAISSRIDKALSSDTFARTMFCSDWFRNCAFIVGAQWLQKGSGGRWEKRNLPKFFPKAITNKIAEKFGDLVNQLVQGGRVPIAYVPASDDEKDLGIAAVGEKVREVMYTEAECDEKMVDMASWLIATGNVFGIPCYSMDEEHGKKFIPNQLCQNPECGASLTPPDLAGGEDGQSPACPECGNTDLQPHVDPDGNEIGEEYPTGAIQMEVASPFEIRFDYRAQTVDKLKRFIRQRRYDVSWAKEQWPDFEDQITPDGGDDDTGQYYLDRLATLTSAFSNGGGLTSSAGNTKNPKVTAYEIYELPTDEFPEGLRAVRLGKNDQAVVEAGPLTTQYGAGTKKNQKFLPLIHFKCQTVPGRIWAKSPIDDIIPLQVYRNMVESNIRLSVQRMGNAMWLMPKGCSVDVLTGEPGQSVSYNPMSVGGTAFAKPERIPAELNNVGALLGLLKTLDDAIERIAGTFFLQGGDAPPGVTAASALAYLGEKGQQSLSLLRGNWAKGWREFDIMGLELARQNWDDARLRVIAGRNKRWQVDSFTKADLVGSVNMIVDYASLAPKSNATERAQVAQLVQLGVIDPHDNETQITVLKKFGALDLKGSLDTDIQDAAKEQDAFLESQGQTQPTIRPFVDNSTVHFHEHVEFAKTDEFRELPPDVQNVWIQHIEATAADIATRRVALTQAGLDPDVPALAEVPSNEAVQTAQQAALLEQQAQQQAAAMQSGGQSSGAQGPDPRLNANGAPAQQGAQGPTPDIAAQGISNGAVNQGMPQGSAPNSIKPPGSPREIQIPGQ